MHAIVKYNLSKNCEYILGIYVQYVLNEDYTILNLQNCLLKELKHSYIYILDPGDLGLKAIRLSSF